MEQNTDQTQLLQALYQDYLTQSIQLREQLAQAQLRIQELEANQRCATCPEVNDQGGSDA